ncbi:MAG: hypothetical protein ACP5O2_00895 [Bacteroidales bacterium]
MLQTFLIKGRFRKGFAVIFALLLTRARAFFDPPSVPDFSSFPFQQWLLGPVLKLPYTAFGLNFLLVAGLALGFNYALRYYRYVPFRSYTGAIIFILLFSHAPWLLTLHPLMLPVLFLSISLVFSLRMSNTRDNYIQIYWAAFFVGLATLSYPLTAAFVLYIILAIAVNAIVRWRELLVVFIGFFNPIILTLGILFLLDYPLPKIWERFEVELHAPQFIHLPLLEWIFTGLATLLSLYVFFSVAGLAGKKSLSFRKYTWLHIWFLIVGLLSSVFAGPHFIFYLALLSIPVSSFLAVYFSEEGRSFKSEVIVLILLVLAIIQNNFTG